MVGKLDTTVHLWWKMLIAQISVVSQLYEYTSSSRSSTQMATHIPALLETVLWIVEPQMDS